MATASISSMGRAVRARLPKGKMTWKKMMRPAGENLSPDNQTAYLYSVRLVGLVKFSFNVTFSFNIKSSETYYVILKGKYANVWFISSKLYS